MVIFDLGGVIVDFDHHTVSRRLSPFSPRTEGEIFQALFQSQLGRDYDLGRMSSEEFFQRAWEALELDLEFGEFQEIWSDIFSLNEEVARLLEELRGRVHLFLLSNTNALHFAHIRRHFPVLEVFEEMLLSFELGMRKPDPRIWQEALQRAGLPAERAAYVDDSLEYVAVARRLGLKGLHFQSSGNLRRELRELLGE